MPSYVDCRCGSPSALETKNARTRVSAPHGAYNPSGRLTLKL